MPSHVVGSAWLCEHQRGQTGPARVRSGQAGTNVDGRAQSRHSIGSIVSDCVFYVQFSDGVILLLLIGQLEGFFIPLCDFSLTPVNHAQMVRSFRRAAEATMPPSVRVLGGVQLGHELQC